MSEKVLLKIAPARVIIQKIFQDPADYTIFFTENNIYLTNRDYKSVKWEVALSQLGLLGYIIANYINKKRSAKSAPLPEKSLQQTLHEDNQFQVIHYGEILEVKTKKNSLGQYIVVKAQNKKYYFKLSPQLLEKVMHILKNKCAGAQKG